MKRLVSLVTTFAMIATMFAGIGPVNAEDSGSMTVKKVEAIEFGSYPQTEIVGEASQCGVYGKVWAKDSDYIVDPELYEYLQHAGADAYNNIPYQNNKYRKVHKDMDVYYSVDNDSEHYQWSDTITYRYFLYEPIKWKILEKDGDKVFLFSNIGLDCQRYNQVNSEDRLRGLDYGVTWENSEIRHWLNDDAEEDLCFPFYAFTENQRNAIIETELESENNTEYDTSSGNKTKDKVFLLSESDVWGEKAVEYGFPKVYYYFSDYAENTRILKSSTYAKAMGVSACDDTLYEKTYQIRTGVMGKCSYWLRTPGETTKKACYVGPEGGVIRDGAEIDTNGYAVCPAIYLDLSKTSDYKVDYAEESEEITADDVTLSETSYEYDGNEKKPEVSIDGLYEGISYTLKYENNVEAGTARVVITGIGESSGQIIKEFTINECDITSKNITLSKKAFTFDGTAKEPEVTVEGLTLDKDYTVSYENNVQSGTAKAVITGIGSCTGTVEKTFKISELYGANIKSIELGSYPQTEIVGESSQSGCYEKNWSTDGDYVVDESLYNKLKTAEFDGNNDVVIDNVKYRRINKSNAVGYSDYNWSDEETYHYFRYDPIKWRVLDVNGTDAFILSDIGLDNQKYHETNDDVTWETCTLRDWLNDDFYNSAFTQEEQKKIISTKIVNEDGKISGADGGDDTIDYVFLLSESETYDSGAVKYGFASNYEELNIARGAKSSTYAKAMGTSVFDLSTSDFYRNCNWWLRSTGSSARAIYVGRTGIVGIYGDSVNHANYAVRPAMHVNLSFIDPENIEYDEDTAICLDDIKLSFDLSSINTPSVSIEGLTKDRDYTVSYEDNTEPGTAKVIITGKGLYSGTVTKEFELYKEDFEGKKYKESGYIRDFGTYNDVRWWFDTSGNLKIYGDGTLNYWDFASENGYGDIDDLKAPLWRYRTYVKNVYITGNVSEVLYLTRYSLDLVYENMEKVVIDSDMEDLPYNLFYKCANLKTVEINGDLETIEHNTFDGCSSLKSIKLPDSLKNIDYYAFYGCSSLESIDLPEGLEKIGECAFDSCSDLDEVYIPESVNSIGGKAFRNCGVLKKVTMPYAVYSKDIFEDTEIEKLILTGAPKTESDIQEIKDEIDSLKPVSEGNEDIEEEIENIDEKIDDLDVNDENFSDDFAQILNSIAKVKGELKEYLDSQIDDLNKDIKAVDSENAEAIADIEEKIESLSTKVKALDEASENDDDIAKLSEDIKSAKTEFADIVSDSVDKLKKELENSIKELEEGKISENESKITEITSKLKVLQDIVATLDETYASKSDLDDFEKDLDTLKTSLVSTITSEINKAKEELDKQIKAIEEGELVQNASSIAGITSQLAALQKIVTGLDENYATDDDVAELIDSLVKMKDDLTKALSDAINNSKDELEKQIKDLEDGKVAENTKAISEISGSLKDLQDAVDALDETYAKDSDIDELNEELEDIKGDLTKAIDDAVAKVKEELEEQIKTLTDGKVAENAKAISEISGSLKDLQDAVDALDETYAKDSDIDELNEELEDIKGDLTKAIDDAVAKVKEELEGKIKDLEDGKVAENAKAISEISGSLKDLQDAVDALDETYAKDSDIDELNEELEDIKGDLTKAIDDAATEVKEELEKAIDELSKGKVSENAENIKTISTKFDEIEELIDSLDETYAKDTDIQNINDSLTKLKEELNDTVASEIERLEKEIQSGLEKTNEQIEKLENADSDFEETAKELKNQADELESSLEGIDAKADSALQDIVKIKEDVEKLYSISSEELEKAIEELKQRVAKLEASSDKDYLRLANAVDLTVSVKKKNANDANVSWNVNTMADGYIVYVKKEGDNSFTKYAKIENNRTAEYLVSGLESGVKYTFKVNSYIYSDISEKIIEGNDSNEVSVVMGLTSISNMKVTLSSTSYVYDGKAKTPAVSVKGLEKGTDYTITYSSNTKCGKAKVVVKGKGAYSGSITKYFNITPAKGKISKTQAGSKSIKVTIKSQKASNVTGYQIYYKKAGSSAKTVLTDSTSKKLTGLTKGKKYKIKVRAYKVIDGKKYYGAYSKAVKVKAK